LERIRERQLLREKQLAEEVSSRAEQLKPREALWLAEVFEHLNEQFVPLEGKGPVAEIFDLVVKKRIPEAVKQFRLERVENFMMEGVAPAYLLEDEAIRFAGLFALAYARNQEVLFAGVVKTEEEKKALLETLTPGAEVAEKEVELVEAAKRILEERIFSAERDGGQRNSYEDARGVALDKLSDYDVTHVTALESNLLIQLRRLLAPFGLRLPSDPAAQEAALLLLYAA
jgi:hypothetical protein